MASPEALVIPDTETCRQVLGGFVEQALERHDVEHLDDLREAMTPDVNLALSGLTQQTDIELTGYRRSILWPIRHTPVRDRLAVIHLTPEYEVDTWSRAKDRDGFYPIIDRRRHTNPDKTRIFSAFLRVTAELTDNLLRS